jgi:restriction system protein
MPIPDYQTLMLPLLKIAGDGQQHSVREARELLADQFSLSPEERAQMLSSGQQAVLANRVGWAKTYLDQAKLLVSERRGVFRITDRGKEILRNHPERIDTQFLESFPEFIEFRQRRKTNDEPVITLDEKETPEEALDAAYKKIRIGLATELLERVKASSPEFFESLVIDLLVKMGYGGSRQEAGKAVGKSGDEGIDGIISEDRLGLDTIYIQAKKWEGTVGRPEIQKFVGALQKRRAKKGVFLTTGKFSAEAEDYVSDMDPKIVLVDGQQLAEYMIDLKLGVSTVAIYETNRIDSDYFSEE